MFQLVFLWCILVCKILGSNKGKGLLYYQRYILKDKERLLELSEEIVEIAIKASETQMEDNSRKEITLICS